MRFLVFIILHLIGFNLLAQSSRIKNQEFSFSAGIAELHIEKFSPNKNLDFINYVDSDPEYLDYIIMKFGYKFDFFTKMSVDIKLILMDDLMPDNYDVSAHYFLRPWLGLGVGSMLNKNYITNFEKFQIQTLPNYYLMDENVQQFTAYDLGFYLSPALKPIDTDIFKLLIKCDLGMATFMNEEANFYHKKNLSNEKLLFHYDTKTKFQPFIQPKLELRLQAFKIKQTSLGILLNSSYYYSKKSIDYVRTVRTWSAENSTIEEIQPPKHNYSRFEFNMGIFVRW